MKEIIKNRINEALNNLGIEDSNFIVEHPTDLKMGDYSTNVAMIYAKELKISPRDLAEKIKKELGKNLPKEIEKIEVAGAGFINFYLSREFFTNSINRILKEKKIGVKIPALLGKKLWWNILNQTHLNHFILGIL